MVNFDIDILGFFHYVPAAKNHNLGKCEFKQILSFCKILPGNPTNHEDSINSKEIQVVGSTLDLLEISRIFIVCLIIW